MYTRSRRFVELLPMSAMAAGFVVAVYWIITAGQPVTEARPVTLDFVWPTYTPQKVRYGEYLAERYMELNPDIYVNLILTPDPYRKLQVMIAGRTTPDVVWMGVGWQQFAGALMPLDPWVDADPVLRPEDYFPSLWEACHWQGTLLCLPSSPQAGVIFYNKDLFDDAGLAYPSPNWTWDDMLHAAKTLTRDFDGNGVIDQYGIQLEQIYRYPFLMYDGQIAGESWQESRMFTPLRVAILEAYRDLIYKHRVMPTPIAAAELGFLPFFEQGRVGMHAASAWALETLRKVSFDWDVALLPWFEFEGNRYRATALWQEEFAVLWDTPVPDEAYAFASWCVSREVLGWASENGHIVPARLDVAYSPQFIDPAKRPSYIRAFVDSLDFAVPMYPHPAWREINRGFEPVFQQFITGADGRRISAEEALRAMDAVLQGILDAYNAGRDLRPEAQG